MIIYTQSVAQEWQKKILSPGDYLRCVLYDLCVGVTLERPVSSTAPSHSSEPPTCTMDTTCTATPHTNSTSGAHTINKSTPPHTSPQLTERTPHGSAVDTNSEGGSDMESSNSSLKLRQPTHTGVRQNNY